MVLPNNAEVRGKIKNAKGTVEETIGRAIGNRKMEKDGAAARRKGSVQQTLGKARRKVGDAVKDLGNAVRKGPMGSSVKSVTLEPQMAPPSQPPEKPARSSPVTMYGQPRISRQRSPER